MTGEPNAFDAWAIAVVLTLRHREGRRHSCRCEECRAVKQVCALAREACAMKGARQRAKTRPERAPVLAVDRSRSSPKTLSYGQLASCDPAFQPELVV